MAKKVFSNRTEAAMVRRLDNLAQFDEFSSELLPKLKEALVRGASAEEIYKLAHAHAAARAVTIALTEKDSAKALAATKDVLDRVGGKAADKQEITHKMASLSDEQLDAMLVSKSKELERINPDEEEDLKNDYM